METILQQAINSVQKCEIALSKFISANDAGKTGGHQSGFYIAKSFLPYVFEQKIASDVDYTKMVNIKWNGNLITESRFKYYGSKNECHLTRFGKGFPFLEDDNVGDLVILCKLSSDYYEGFIIQSDDEIEDFFSEMNMSSTDTNGIIPKQFQKNNEEKLLECFDKFITSLKIEFPSTVELAANARKCYNSINKVNEKNIADNPDKLILNWLTAEFDLFKLLENNRYSEIIKKQFANVEDLIQIANTILNRRKSRAGHSLEHHLAEIFKISHLVFEPQAITEDNKKPDFLFPGRNAYLNKDFDSTKIITLASKTTCKDRWRQILNEADRVKTKHLFTLQQGISKNQLEEMYKYNVCLVVPKSYIHSFPSQFKDQILSLDTFIKKIQLLQV